jgi:hypothetical protein
MAYATAGLPLDGPTSGIYKLEERPPAGFQVIAVDAIDSMALHVVPWVSSHCTSPARSHAHRTPPAEHRRAHHVGGLRYEARPYSRGR